jgi:hypothetical protein
VHLDERLEFTCEQISSPNQLRIKMNQFSYFLAVFIISIMLSTPSSTEFRMSVVKLGKLRIIRSNRKAARSVATCRSLLAIKCECVHNNAGCSSARLRLTKRNITICEAIHSRCIKRPGRPTCRNVLNRKLRVGITGRCARHILQS